MAIRQTQSKVTVPKANFSAYAASIGSSCAKGNERIKHDVVEFLTAKQQALDDKQTIQSEFAPYEIQTANLSADELERTIVEMSITREGDQFDIEYKCQRSVVARKDSPQQDPDPEPEQVADERAATENENAEECTNEPGDEARSVQQKEGASAEAAEMTILPSEVKKRVQSKKDTEDAKDATAHAHSLSPAQEEAEQRIQRLDQDAEERRRDAERTERFEKAAFKRLYAKRPQSVSPSRSTQQRPAPPQKRKSGRRAQPVVEASASGTQLPPRQSFPAEAVGSPTVRHEPWKPWSCGRRVPSPERDSRRSSSPSRAQAGGLRAGFKRSDPAVRNRLRSHTACTQARAEAKRQVLEGRYALPGPGEYDADVCDPRLGGSWRGPGASAKCVNRRIGFGIPEPPPSRPSSAPAGRPRPTVGRAIGIVRLRQPTVCSSAHQRVIMASDTSSVMRGEF